MTLFEFFNNRNIIKDTSQKFISVSGGGGKTSFLYSYARYYDKNYGKLLITSTTKMYYPYSYCSIFDKIIISNNFNILNLLNEEVIIFAMHSENKENGKLIGFDKIFLEYIFRKNIYNTIVSESDGSNRKSIKAPNIYEPLHPSNATDIVGVIGLSSYKKTINNCNIHRVNTFINITNTKIGDHISIKTIIDLINSKLGLFKNTPKNARKHLLINQSDTVSDRELDYIFDILKDNVDNLYSIIFCSLLSNDKIIKYFIFPEKKMIL